MAVAVGAGSSVGSSSSSTSSSSTGSGNRPSLVIDTKGLEKYNTTDGVPEPSPVSEPGTPPGEDSVLRMHPMTISQQSHSGILVTVNSASGTAMMQSALDATPQPIGSAGVQRQFVTMLAEFRKALGETDEVLLPPDMKEGKEEKSSQTKITEEKTKARIEAKAEATPKDCRAHGRIVALKIANGAMWVGIYTAALYVVSPEAFWEKFTWVQLQDYFFGKPALAPGDVSTTGLLEAMHMNTEFMRNTAFGACSVIIVGDAMANCLTVTPIATAKALWRQLFSTNPLTAAEWKYMEESKEKMRKGGKAAKAKYAFGIFMFKILPILLSAIHFGIGITTNPIAAKSADFLGDYKNEVGYGALPASTVYYYCLFGASLLGGARRMQYEFFTNNHLFKSFCNFLVKNPNVSFQIAFTTAIIQLVRDTSFMYLGEEALGTLRPQDFARGRILYRYSGSYFNRIYDVYRPFFEHKR